jgi:heptaprenyl diphosphate synthase
MQRPSEPELRTIALLAAFALFLSTIEYMIPKPLPFMRIGLANLPILIAVFIFDFKSILILILLKVIGQGFVNGTLVSYVFIFSLCGSFASGLVMIGSKRLFKTRISIIGVSILGALASNLVQLLLARALVVGESARLIAPPFLLIGLISSTVLGVFAYIFLLSSRWVALYSTWENG